MSGGGAPWLPDGGEGWSSSPPRPTRCTVCGEPGGHRDWCERVTQALRKSHFDAAGGREAHRLRRIAP